MVHVAQAEKFYEQDYYTPSNDGFKVFDTIFGKKEDSKNEMAQCQKCDYHR